MNMRLAPAQKYPRAFGYFKQFVWALRCSLAHRVHRCHSPPPLGFAPTERSLYAAENSSKLSSGSFHARLEPLAASPARAIGACHIRVPTSKKRTFVNGACSTKLLTKSVQKIALGYSWIRNTPTPFSCRLSTKRPSFGERGTCVITDSMRSLSQCVTYFSSPPNAYRCAGHVEHLDSSCAVDLCKLR